MDDNTLVEGYLNILKTEEGTGYHSDMAGKTTRPYGVLHTMGLDPNNYSDDPTGRSLAKDVVKKHLEALRKQKIDFDNMPTSMKLVALDTHYNLGTFNSTPSFKKALQNKNYKKALYETLDVITAYDPSTKKNAISSGHAGRRARFYNYAAQDLDLPLITEVKADKKRPVVTYTTEGGDLARKVVFKQSKYHTMSKPGIRDMTKEAGIIFRPDIEDTSGFQPFKKEDQFIDQKSPIEDTGIINNVDDTLKRESNEQVTEDSILDKAKKSVSDLFEPRKRIVQSGDTLINIAKDEGLTFSELLSMNPELASDPDDIKVDQSINVSKAGLLGKGMTLGETNIGFNKGGSVTMAQQMDMFEEGGLLQEGGTVDPVSGNDVPVGSLQEEVRDDIPAQLSEGEFVMPADVVRYHGLDKMMALRDEAKAGLSRMEAMGQMGNAEEATIPDGIPFNMEDLELEEEDEGPMEMQVGGYVPYSPYSMEAAPTTPSKGVQPTFEQLMPTTSGQYSEIKTFVNDAGMIMNIPFIGGKPIYPVPPGYKLKQTGPVSPEMPTAPMVQTRAPEVKPEGREERDDTADRYDAIRQTKELLGVTGTEGFDVTNLIPGVGFISGLLGKESPKIGGRTQQMGPPTEKVYRARERAARNLGIDITGNVGFNKGDVDPASGGVFNRYGISTNPETGDAIGTGSDASYATFTDFTNVISAGNKAGWRGGFIGTQDSSAYKGLNETQRQKYDDFLGYLEAETNADKPLTELPSPKPEVPTTQTEMLLDEPAAVETRRPDMLDTQPAYRQPMYDAEVRRVPLEELYPNMAQPEDEKFIDFPSEAKPEPDIGFADTWMDESYTPTPTDKYAREAARETGIDPLGLMRPKQDESFAKAQEAAGRRREEIIARANAREAEIARREADFAKRQEEDAAIARQEQREKDRAATEEREQRGAIRQAAKEKAEAERKQRERENLAAAAEADKDRTSTKNKHGFSDDRVRDDQGTATGVDKSGRISYDKDHDWSKPTQTKVKEEKGDGGDKPGKIVCTEMYRQTQLDDWTKAIKIWDVYQKKHLTPYHEKGYHWLFKPYVQGMKKSNLLTKFGAYLAKQRTQHLRHVLTKGRAKDSIVGNVWCKIIHPIVYLAGRIK